MIHKKSSSSSSQSYLLVAVFVLFASSTIHPTSALSWPLCENGGTVWVTERPRTEPQFPGANLWFFCEGSLNVLGNSISACVPGPDNETTCLPQVAEAVCQLLGYEKSFPEDTEIAPASPQEPVVTLTGDYCLRKGVFASEIPEDLASMPGEPCDKIQKLTCIRTIDAMAAAASIGVGAPLNVLQPTPAAEDLASTAQLAEQQAAQRQQPEEVSVATGNPGRKLLKHA
jgi:hypothetical protein